MNMVDDLCNVIWMHKLMEDAQHPRNLWFAGECFINFPPLNYRHISGSWQEASKGTSEVGDQCLWCRFFK